MIPPCAVFSWKCIRLCSAGRGLWSCSGMVRGQLGHRLSLGWQSTHSSVLFLHTHSFARAFPWHPEVYGSVGQRPPGSEIKRTVRPNQRGNNGNRRGAMSRSCFRTVWGVPPPACTLQVNAAHRPNTPLHWMILSLLLGGRQHLWPLIKNRVKRL